MIHYDIINKVFTYYLLHDLSRIRYLYLQFLLLMPQAGGTTVVKDY